MNAYSHGQEVPLGDCIPAKRHGGLIFTSGMTPRRNGELMFTGPVRGDAPIEDNRDAVVLACSNPLAAAGLRESDGVDAPTASLCRSGHPLHQSH